VFFLFHILGLTAFFPHNSALKKNPERIISIKLDYYFMGFYVLGSGFKTDFE
jgi:hypothetical protein